MAHDTSMPSHRAGRFEFYRPPARIPEAPGQLLKAVPHSPKWLPPGARGWRILYTTTLTEGERAVCSGMVVVPRAATGRGAAGAPVIGWAHGTTGVDARSAPTIVDRWPARGGMYVDREVAAAGWAMVSTDYAGLGTAGQHRYLVGQPAGRNVLDALRAARRLPRVRLREETVLWGHSQGGHAVLWAAGLAGDYAPGIDIRGAAAMAPVADVPVLIERLRHSLSGVLLSSWALTGYAAAYDDVRFADYVHPDDIARVRTISARGLSDPRTVTALARSAVTRRPRWVRGLTTGPFGRRLQENVPTAPVAVPVLIGQGGKDSVALPDAQEAFVAGRRAAGQEIDYRHYPGLAHDPLVRPRSPFMTDLFTWTRNRFTAG